MSWTAPENGPSPTYYQPVYQGVFDDGADKRVTLPWREWSDGQGVGDTQYTLEVESAADLRVNTYDFTVRACNDEGCSAYTRTVSMKVAGAPEVEQQQQQQEQSGVPGPVVNLSLSAASDSLTVTWEAPETGGTPDRYIVHLKPADGSKGKVKKPKAGKGERATATTTLPSEGGVQGGQGDPPPEPTPIPTPEPTPEPQPEQQEPEQGPEEPQNEDWRRYDANGDGVIDFSELDAATADWIAGKITDEEYQEVVKRLG